MNSHKKDIHNQSSYYSQQDQSEHRKDLADYCQLVPVTHKKGQAQEENGIQYWFSLGLLLGLFPSLQDRCWTPVVFLS